MVDSEARNVLVNDILEMGRKHSIAYLELTQPHHTDGKEKGTIVVNAYEVYQECRLTVPWPVAEVRELWKRTIQILPTLQSRAGDSNSGFTDWLWTQIQRTWRASNERGIAIDPFVMWDSFLANGCAGEEVVCSKPLLASAMEVSLMARRAKWIAENAQQIETDAVHRQEISRASYQVQADSTLERNTYEACLIDGRATLDFQSYRKAEKLRVRLRNWAEAVANYEQMLLPESAKKRPTGSEFTADLIQHFRSCSVELSRHANSMTTGSSSEAQPAENPKAVTQATGNKRGQREGSETSDPNANQDQTRVEIPVLSDKGYLILETMLELKADSPNTRKTSTEIAEACDGKAAEVNTFKPILSSFSNELGLTMSKTGRGGGVWLTPHGIQVASQVVDKQKAGSAKR